MYTLSIDPGETTGVAIIQSLGTDNSTVLLTARLVHLDPYIELANLIDNFWDTYNGAPEGAHIVVEDFIGAGRRNEERSHTTKLLGFVEGFCTWRAMDFSVQVPQTRKAFIENAKTIIGDDKGVQHKFGASIRHVADALAHAMAYNYYHYAAKANKQKAGSKHA